MPNLRLADLTAEIEANVRRALLEDIGSGDILAHLTRPSGWPPHYHHARRRCYRWTLVSTRYPPADPRVPCIGGRRR